MTGDETPSDDAFVTVAVTYSQPEAAVLLSMFAAHGVPAYALGEHARVQSALTTALGGIPVRVHRPALAEARSLLSAAAGPPVVRPRLLRNGVVNALALLAALLLGGVAPPPRVRSELFDMDMRPCGV